MQSRGTVLAGVAAATVLVVALFEGSLLRRDLLVARDLPRQFYPRLDVIGQSLAEGAVPRWNPWCGHGAPWFGPRTGGVVYPANALFAVLSPGRAMAAFIALHTLIAVLGAWRLFARDRDASPWPGALAWGLGGFVTSMHWALPYLVSAAWLPWGLLGARMIAAGERRGVALLGLAVAMMLLVTEPQGVIILALLAGATVLVHSPPARWPAAVGLVAIAGLVGAAAGAVTVLSILDELSRIDRGLESWREVRFELQPVALVIDALVPNLYGQHAQHLGGFWGVHAWGSKDLPWCALGVGSLGAVAVLAGTFARWRDRAWIEGAVWVLLGIGLAAFPEVTDALDLRYPSKWLVITALGLARLVALGASVLERGAWWPAPTALLAYGAALTALGGVALLGSASLAELIASRAPGWVVAKHAADAVIEALLRTGLTAFPAWLACAAAGQPRWRRPHVRALLVGALALDLLTAAHVGLLSLDGASVPVHDEPALVARLRKHAGGPEGAPVRFEPKEVFWRQQYPPIKFAEREVLDRDALRPNIGYRFGVRTVIAFESVEPAAQRKLMYDQRYLREPILWRYARIDGELALCDRREGDDLGVPIERVGMITPIDPYDDLVAVKNPLCPPWAYLSTTAVVGTDLTTALDLLVAPGFPVGDRVVLGPEGVTEADATDGEDGPLPGVRVSVFEAERVALEVEARSDAWLVVRDAWAPDWEARLDGRPVSVARADLLYRAVRVPAGTHRVEFTYAPRWWTPALALTAVGWALLAALSARGARRPRTHRSSGSASSRPTP